MSSDNRNQPGRSVCYGISDVSASMLASARSLKVCSFARFAAIRVQFCQPMRGKAFNWEFQNIAQLAQLAQQPQAFMPDI